MTLAAFGYNHPMAKNRRPEDLSVEELRRLLIEKRRASRTDRLERFRKTGRVATLSEDTQPETLANYRSGAVEDDQLPETGGAPSRRRRFVDYILLLVEVAAVLGLVFILLNGVNLVRELNREVLAAIEQPTMTPTPLISAVVLPSGHIPPDALGHTAPNEAEIPEHLRPLVQSLVNLPTPTPGPQQAIRIQIPAINVDAPVVMGDGWEQLKKGVGQHVGSANPGEKGNHVLSAHNDIYGEIFRELDQLNPGDQITLFTSNQRVYTYLVTGTRVVLPTQVEVLAPTSSATVTLISCYPYLKDDKRIVVTARLLSGN